MPLLLLLLLPLLLLLLLPLLLLLLLPLLLLLLLLLFLPLLLLLLLFLKGHPERSDGPMHGSNIPCTPKLLNPQSILIASVQPRKLPSHDTIST